MAVVVGAGSGLGFAIARRLTREGFAVAACKRREGDIAEECAKLNREIRQKGGNGFAVAFSLDARKESDVASFFGGLEATMLAAAQQEIGGHISATKLEIVVFNVGAWYQESVLTLSGEKFAKIWQMACFGGFLVGREAAKLLLARGKGTIIFTGATASTRGASGFAAFASAKSGLRAMAQAMARELGPQNVHVAHIVVDGAIDTPFIRDRFKGLAEALPEGGMLSPDAIASAYLFVHRQPRSAWTFELDLRPHSEKW